MAGLGRADIASLSVFADNVSAEIFSYDGQFGCDTAYFDGRVDAIGDFNGDGRDDVPRYPERRPKQRNFPG